MVKPIISEVVISKNASFLFLLSSALIIIGSIGVSIYSTIIRQYSRNFIFGFISLIVVGLLIYAILKYTKHKLIINAYLLTTSSNWKRIFPKEVNETEDTCIKIIGEVSHLQDAINAYLVDEVPENFRIIENSNNWYGKLSHETTILLKYKVKPVFGTHYFGPLNINLYDPYGFFTVKLQVPLSSAIKVLPSIIIDPREIVLNLSSRIPGGLSLTNRPGIGIEYFSTRDYMPGDDYRFIDWKATARLRRIMVKDFEEEASLFILILFLITPNMYRGAYEIAKVVVMSRLISTLSNYLGFRGDIYALGYIVTTYQPIIRFTGYGRGYGHTYFIRNVLSGIPWITNFFFKDISNEFLSIVGKMIRREKTNIIIFTDFNDNIIFAENILSSLSKFKKLGHNAIIIMPHTLLYEEEFIKLELLRRGKEDLIEPALTLHKIYSDNKIAIIDEIINLIKNYGFKVIYTSPRDTILSIIRELELMRRCYGFV